MDENWYSDEDINGKQLGKFSSAKDGLERKYMQKPLLFDLPYRPIRKRVHSRSHATASMSQDYWGET